MQGFHLLPDLLPVVSLIRASLKTAGCDKYLAADFYPPATDGCSRVKCLFTQHHTRTVSEPLSLPFSRAAELPAAFGVARR